MADLRPTGTIAAAAGWVLAGAAMLGLTLVLGGGAPRAAPVGLPDAGQVLAWADAVAPLVRDLAGAVTVGLALLSGGWLAPVTGIATLATALAAVVWATADAAALAVLALTLRVESAQWHADGSAATMGASPEVRALAAQATLALGVALLVWAAPTWRRACAPLAVVALVPPLLTGHVRTAEAPVITGLSLTIHVIVASLWVGGLAALGWVALRDRMWWAQAVPRFSQLALWCVVMLALSGLATALGRIPSLADLTGTAYGTVVLLKAVLLGGLAALGYLQRRYTIGRSGQAVRDFTVLAGAELTLMALALGLAAGLSQTPPPS
jgi:putative copper resistance protein D